MTGDLVTPTDQIEKQPRYILVPWDPAPPGPDPQLLRRMGPVLLAPGQTPPRAPRPSSVHSSSAPLQPLRPLVGVTDSQFLP